MFKLDDKKYKASFMYLLMKLEEIKGKKKACKLLYFLDFDFFEAYNKSFTGETYYKYKMGPFTKSFDETVEELKKDGYLNIKKEKMCSAHENDTNVYKLKKDMNYKFSKEEKQMLDRVVRVYGQQNGKMLEELSHTQAPWQAVEMSQPIPYEFSYYRETKNLKE